MPQLEIGFYNTIKATPAEMQVYNDQANSLEGRILSLFRYHNKPMAWFQVKQLLPENTNDCSIKRCLSNLSDVIRYEKRNKKPPMRMTEEMILGVFNKPCHKYSLNNVA